MTEILHRRTRLENTTLNRGCGGRSHNRIVQYARAGAGFLPSTVGLRPLGVVMMTIDCRAHDEAYCQAKIHDEAGQAKIHGCYFFGGKSLQKLPSMFFSQIKDLIPLPKRNGLNG